MAISFSRYLALVLGIVTPVAETIRRWSTWRSDPPALVDDYILETFFFTEPGVLAKMRERASAFWWLVLRSCVAWLTTAFLVSYIT